MAALCAPPPDDATQRALRDAERARAADVAARKDAVARAVQATIEEHRLVTEQIATAARLRELEQTTDTIAGRIEDLATRRRSAETRLRARAAAMRPLLPVIERLSLYPAETLLAVPAPPETAMRALIVLRSLSHRLEQDAVILRRDQADIDTAARDLMAESPRLTAALGAQAAQAAALDRQLAAARALRDQAETDAEAAERRASAEAARADTLRAALAALEARRRAEEARAREDAIRAERDKKQAEAESARRREAAFAHPAGAGTMAAAGAIGRPNGRPNGNAGGRLIAPVAGTLIRGWGDATEAGPATGLSYHDPPMARVVSPCGGRAVFADTFRSFGLLTIIDCGGGFHAVLAGFERLDIKAGRPVQAGEPLGTMPDWEPGGGGKRPSLYVELRRDGQPVNPTPWLKPSL
jgi:septal ring factor EnvC (AmiA/AmiB activator)